MQANICEWNEIQFILNKWIGRQKALQNTVGKKII